MTRPKLPISGPITSPARCLNCGMRTFAYLGDPLAATGLWKCSGCKWRQIGVRPHVNADRPDGPEEEPVRAHHAVIPPFIPHPPMAVVNAALRVHPSGRPILLETIVIRVCRECCIERPELLTKSRHKRIVLARRMIVALARMLTRYSHPDIAEAMSPPSIYSRRANHSNSLTCLKRYDTLKGYKVRQLLAEADPAGAYFGEQTLQEVTERLSVEIGMGRKPAEVSRETEQARV